MSEELLILDFTQRLPGPLAGAMLANRGARVVKIEDHKRRDSFHENGFFSQMDDSFVTWYQDINCNKEIMSFDFNNESDQKEILELVKKCDGVLQGLPEKVVDKLGIRDELYNGSKPKVILHMKASNTHTKSLHDLNILAQEGLLKTHLIEQSTNVVAPPFMPIAGIVFGPHIAMDFYRGLLEARAKDKTIEVTSTLECAVKEQLTPFLGPANRNKFLHNGLYPCYNIYRLADGEYVALAAVEEKFWQRFCDIFELPLGPTDRFTHENSNVFDCLSKLFSGMSSNELNDQIRDEDICLSLIVR
jgi:crotonobetainyl-CoA:carnitine CoA-transferase CaiB-like acyl-CoA transferase